MKKMMKVREYPLHTNINRDFTDDKDQAVLEFLAKEVLYTSHSMVEIDNMKSTFMDEPINLPDDLIFSEKHVYFKREA